MSSDLWDKLEAIGWPNPEKMTREQDPIPTNPVDALIHRFGLSLRQKPSIPDALHADAWDGDKLFGAAVAIALRKYPITRRQRRIVLAEAVSNMHVALCSRIWTPPANNGRDSANNSAHSFCTRFEAALLYLYDADGMPAVIIMADYIVRQCGCFPNALKVNPPIDNTQGAALTGKHDDAETKQQQQHEQRGRDSSSLRAHASS